MTRNFSLPWYLYVFAIMFSAGTMRSAEAVDESPTTIAATFIRAVNLNGPAMEIDGQAWQAGDASDIEVQGSAFDNQNVRLNPKTDRWRQTMIRSSRWGSSVDVKLLNLPANSYRIFLYVWEDNNSENYSILLNEKTVVERHASGHAGQWNRLGPWTATADDGMITLSSRGGAANFSGIEVWSSTGELPEFSPVGPINTTPTPEQIAFFETKIRPVLIERCYQCHNADADEVGGGLLLDSRRGIIKGGDSGPTLVPRNAADSLLMAALKYTNEELQMPPDDPLEPHVVADFEQWIEQGAPDPRSEDTVALFKSKHEIDWTAAREFWSLKPLADTVPPSVGDASWPLVDIDRFVLERLEDLGLEPAPDASREVWIRRATYDLTGLPPTPTQIDNFVNDTSDQAFATVVDRLLASTEYGQRWGRHWLDVVRYADTAGDNSDFPIPQIIKYRDWVIDAFNKDLPYDQFVREQLAGDLLPANNQEDRNRHLVATGYLAGARRFGSRVSDYPQHLTIEDTIDNLGKAFLATTINCARCHDHKFDPITADDYYALYGIFQSTRYPWPGIELDQKQRDLVPLVSKEQVEREQTERAQQQQQLDDQVQQLEQQHGDAAEEHKESLKKQLDEARDAAKQFAKQFPSYEQAYAVIDAEQAGDAEVQIKGDPTKTGETIPRRFLSVLGGQPLAEGDSTSGRLQLANWIVDRQNPLAPRVIVNRVWLYHFGSGLVPRPNDFGRQGNAPSHPALLDWLARRFMDQGWSIKSLHRQIMLSRTYRMDSHISPRALQIDPTNVALSHFPRRRMDAESIRDTLLALGGTLDVNPGEPHPFPPPNKWNFTQHNPFKAIYDTPHRSVYLMTQRIQRHPFLAIFDGADPSASTAARPVSTTPLQALYFMNDPLVHEQATGFAKRMIASVGESQGDDGKYDTAQRQRIVNAYRWALGRVPTAEELDDSQRLLAAVMETKRNSETSNEEVELVAWQSLVRSIFRLNEFVYID